MPARQRTITETELSPCFTISKPDRWTAPIVFCSPHSGRTYPKHFLAQSKLDPHTLRKSEDCYIDVLVERAPSYGAPLIAALFPRAYLDVNREPYELDPSLFDEPLPDFANAQSTRVIGGLGTVARIVSDGTEIYDRPLSLSAAIARIDNLYHPFHRALKGLINRTRQHFGRALLVDCHSMPSNSMTGSGRARPDIVLGDRFGTSCDSLIVGFLQRAFGDLGYVVHVNRPYAGGYITEHYGRPSTGIDALQIEFNRGLYLNEETLKTTSGFHGLQADIETVIGRLASDLPNLLNRPEAAE